MQQYDHLVRGRLIKRFRLPADTLLSFYEMEGRYFSIMTNSLSSKILKQEETTLERMGIVADIYRDNEISPKKSEGLPGSTDSLEGDGSVR